MWPFILLVVGLVVAELAYRSEHRGDISAAIVAFLGVVAGLAIALVGVIWAFLS